MPFGLQTEVASSIATPLEARRKVLLYQSGIAHSQRIAGVGVEVLYQIFASLAALELPRSFDHLLNAGYHSQLN